MKPVSSPTTTHGEQMKCDARENIDTKMIHTCFSFWLNRRESSDCFGKSVLNKWDEPNLNSFREASSANIHTNAAMRVLPQNNISALRLINWDQRNHA